MSLPANDQCALDANGVLKDASAIAFYNDPDDVNPISPAQAPSASSARLQPSTIHDFFQTSGVSPARVVAGERRTSARQKRNISQVTEFS